MHSVLGIILGGGQGSRLFPLTQTRSKPAVPIGGKYRLVDVPISNCLHADLLEAHVAQQADITVAALPATLHDATSMGLFLFDREGQIAGFEEKPSAERLSQIGGSVPPGSPCHSGTHDPDKPFIASMGIYMFSRDVLLQTLKKTAGTDFGREIIPASLGSHRVKAYLHGGYWADVGTVESFYEANILLTRPEAPFRFYDPQRPVFTHERFLPPSHMRSCTVRESIVADGCVLDDCAIEQSVIGIRTQVGRGTRITRSVGADAYDAEGKSAALGIGRDVVLDRVIIDKNAVIGDGARLTNAGGVPHADGDGFYIRNGITIVPKGGTIAAGRSV